MTDEEIFDLAEQYGWLDDFGRWNFKDDGLISFALAIKTAEREACARAVDDYAEIINGKVDDFIVTILKATAALILMRGRLREKNT